MNISKIPDLVKKIKEFNSNNKNNIKNIDFSEEEIFYAIEYGNVYLREFIIKTEKEFIQDNRKLIQSIINKDTYKFFNKRIVEKALNKNILNYEFIEDKYKTKENSFKYFIYKLQQYNKNPKSYFSINHIPVIYMKSDFLNILYNELEIKSKFSEIIETILIENCATAILDQQLEFQGVFEDKFSCKQEDFFQKKDSFIKSLHKFLIKQSLNNKDFFKMSSNKGIRLLTKELVENNLKINPNLILDKENPISRNKTLLNEKSAEILFSNEEQDISLIDKSFQKKEWMDKFMKKDFAKNIYNINPDFITKEMVDHIIEKSDVYNLNIIKAIPKYLQTQELIDIAFAKNKYIVADLIRSINPDLQTQEIADYILKSYPYFAQYIRNDLKNYEYSMCMLKEDTYNFTEVPPELINLEMIKFMEMNHDGFYRNSEFMKNIPQQVFLDNIEYFKEKISNDFTHSILKNIENPLLFQDKNTIKKIAKYKPEIIKDIDPKLITNNFIFYVLYNIKNDISLFSENQIKTKSFEIDKKDISIDFH